MCDTLRVNLSQVTAVNQVWGTEITCIPLKNRILYLVAILDHFSRNVYYFGEEFAYIWKLSNRLDTEFCLEALEIALGVAASQKYSTPINDARLPWATTCPGCSRGRSRSFGRGESVATTASGQTLRPMARCAGGVYWAVPCHQGSARL